MKKILISSGILFVISLFFMVIALFVSGFDIYALTNFDNYERKEQTFDNVLLLEIDQCPILKIKSHNEDEILVVYYTNDKTNYIFKNQNNYLNIIGSVENNTSNGIFSPRTMTIYLPDNMVRDISIKSDNCVLDIEDINVDNIVVENKDGVINLGNVICDLLFVSLDTGIMNIKKVDCKNIEVEMFTGILNVKLPYEKSKYTLDIQVDAFCNVSSGGNGEYLLKLSTSSTFVNVKFA